MMNSKWEAHHALTDQIFAPDYVFTLTEEEHTLQGGAAINSYIFVPGFYVPLDYYQFNVDGKQICVKIRTHYVKIDEHHRFFRLLYGNSFNEADRPIVQVMRNGEL